MRKILTVLVLTLALLLPSGVALGKEFPAMTNVPLDKIWTINFNHPLKLSTVYHRNIYITDSKNTKILIGIDISRDNKTLTIKTAPSYLSDENYTIHLSSKLQDSRGNNLEETILKFKTVSQ